MVTEKDIRLANGRYAPVGVLGSILVVAILSGCGLGTTPEDRVQRAQVAYTEGDYRAAIIDSKNVLQEQPDNAAARLLLGKASVAVGDAVGGEKELRRALDLGVSRDDVLVHLGRSLLMQQEYQRLLDELAENSNSDPESRQLLQLMADAHMGLQNAETARELYTRALETDGDNYGLHLSIARSYAVENNMVQARSTLEQLIGSQPEIPDGWLLSGVLRMADGDADRAAGDFAQASSLARESGNKILEVQALTSLADAQLAGAQLANARQTVAELKHLAPESIGYLTLSGRIALEERDWPTAQEQLLTALRQSPDYLPARMLLGAVHLQSGNLGQAEMYLSTVVASQPANQRARRLLAETRLLLNKADEAREVLQPVLDEENPDPVSMSMAARISLNEGDVGSATGVLEEVAVDNPDSPDAQLNLAAAYLLAGRIEDAKAVIDRTDVSGSDDAEFRRDTLTALTEYQRDSSRALTHFAHLRNDWQARPIAHTLYGVALLANGQYPEARRSMEIALELDPDSPGITRYLAQIDEAEDDHAAAAVRYQSLITSNDHDTDAMIGLARLAAAKNNVAETQEWLEKAHNTNRRAIKPRVALGRFYLTSGRYKLAADIAREGIEINENAAHLHNVLGLARFYEGDSGEAVRSLQRAWELDSGNSEFRLNLARANAASGNEEKAIELLRGGDTNAEIPIREGVLLAQLEWRQGHRDASREVISRLRNSYPDQPLPLALQAELEAASGNIDVAVSLYDEALSREQLQQFAVRAYALRKQAGRDDSEQPLLGYLAERPLDVPVRIRLAQHYDQLDDNDNAVAAYERVHELEPENVVAANNLAWNYFEVGDSRAEEMARHAYSLAPDSASVADTLGWILVQNKKTAEGLGLLREAASIEPRPEIQYHVAAALVAGGQPAEARDMLEQLLASNEVFASRNEAQALLASL